LNASFGFKGSGTPLREYTFSSAFFKSLQTHAGFAASIPLPLPYAYLQGIDLVRFHERTGFTFGNNYLLGKNQSAEPGESRGFKGYYFLVMCFKEPLAAQILSYLALVLCLARWRRFDWRRDIVFLWVPYGFYFFLLNFDSQANIGIRHFLLVQPLLYVFMGSLAAQDLFTRPVWKWGLGALGLWQAVSVASYFPNNLAYFNELVGDRRMTWRIAADSNLDWHQSDHILIRYLQEHPGMAWAPEMPAAGRFVIDANDLVGVFGGRQGPEKYRWLRENFKPIEQVGYCNLIYEVKEEDLLRLGTYGVRNGK
jgi:hypothetical protein